MPCNILIAMAIISSLRRSLTFMTKWPIRLECRLHYQRPQCLYFFFFLSPFFFFSFLPPLVIFFFFFHLSHIINLLLHSFWVGQYRGIFTSQVMYCPSLRCAVLPPPSSISPYGERFGIYKGHSPGTQDVK